MSGTDTDTSRDSSQLHSGHSGNEEREEKLPADGQNDEELSPDEEYAEIANLSRQGYQLLKKGNVSDAIECFREIIEVDPENNYALVGIGDAYRKKRRYQEATHYYQRCLQFYPENNYALFGLADCYRNHEAVPSGHRSLGKISLVLDDRNVTVLTRVADAYRKVKNLERSEAIYLSVLEMEKPTIAYALIGLGHLHYDFQKFRKGPGVLACGCTISRASGSIFGF
jgi:tetratricopeptide (TPR) repeat protein